MTFYWQIQAAEQSLEQIRWSYLQHRGWRQTCDFPGSLWVWERDFFAEDEARLQSWHKLTEGKPQERWPSKPRRYGVVRVPINMAISITLSDLDEQQELSEEQQ